jgi:hypothetical protein
MCSIAIATLVTTIAATALTVRGQIQQADYTEGVSKYNARVAENQAEKVRSAGVTEENIQRRKTAQLLSKQQAQLGAAGVELGSGSALQLQEDTVTLGEADALRIRSITESKIGALGTQAELLRGQGEAAQSLAATKTAGTILSGGGKALDTGVADKWFTPDSTAFTSENIIQ